MDNAYGNQIRCPPKAEVEGSNPFGSANFAEDFATRGDTEKPNVTRTCPRTWHEADTAGPAFHRSSKRLESRPPQALNPALSGKAGRDISNSCWRFGKGRVHA